MIRLIGDEILLDGVTVGKLLPNLTRSLRDKLEEAFDELDEDEDEDELELDEEIERLIRAMAEGGRPPNLAARMARARMRLVAEGPDSRAGDAHPGGPGDES